MGGDTVGWKTREDMGHGKEDTTTHHTHTTTHGRLTDGWSDARDGGMELGRGGAGRGRRYRATELGWVGEDLAYWILGSAD